MKFLVLLCLMCVAVTVVCGKKNKHDRLKKAFEECQKDEATKLDQSIAKKLRKNKNVDLPENYGDHKLCVLKGAGYFNDDNTVNEEALQKRVAKKARESQNINEIVAECKVPKATPKETALNIEQCLKKHEIHL